MLLDELKSVLTFAAFRPDFDDADLTWSKRYAGRRSLLINISRGSVTWRSIDRKGRLQEMGSQDGEFSEVANSRAEEWRSMTDGGWCSISINNRFIVSLESNLSRRENFTELLRSNPKAVLGSKFDRSKRYAVFHHPRTPASMLMSCEEAMVKSVEDVLRANTLKAGRICCGLFAMLEGKLQEIYDGKHPDGGGSFLLMAMSEGSIAALVQQDGNWTDLRCRSGMSVDSPDSVLQIVSPLLSKMNPGAPVYFAHDGNDSKTAGALLEQLTKFDVKDISGEDLLWITIGQN